MANTGRRHRPRRHSAAHHDDEGQGNPPARHERSNLISDVPRLTSARPYQDESGGPASDATLASPSYRLSRGETSRHGRQPSHLPAVQSIPQSSFRRSVHESAQPSNYLSGAYDAVSTQRAYNTRGNYRASGEYNSTSIDALTTDFAHMGTRFTTQRSPGLNSDVFGSHDYQPASPHGHYQPNPSSVPGYRPPDVAPTRNPEAHQSASRRLVYTPMSAVGSDHARTHGTAEESSSPLETLRNRKAYSIRGESRAVYRPQTLDWSYQVQKPPGEFFVVGRVFAILWHEGRGQQGTVISDFIGQGQSTQSQFIRGRFGEEIFSGIRRMVVVRPMSQCAWCVPITTYGGKGVAKAGVDPEKHAIVYMRGSVPTPKADEPRMTMEPLEVEPASFDEKLDEMSRLNFGKVYTVEHNVKVRNVGMISRRSMVEFRGYARNEFRLDI